MRRSILNLLLAVAVLLPLVVLTFVLDSKPVLATYGCAVGTDSNGVVYTDWHAQEGITVHDSFPGGNPTHVIYLDLWAYRYTGDGVTGTLGECYRAYYGSTWSSDGSGGTYEAAIEAFIGGAGPFTWDSGACSNCSRNDVESNSNFFFNPISLNVTLPDNDVESLVFGHYTNGTTLYLPSGDTNNMDAKSSTWTPSELFSNSQGSWYCYTTTSDIRCYTGG